MAERRRAPVGRRVGHQAAGGAYLVLSVLDVNMADTVRGHRVKVRGGRHGPGQGSGSESPCWCGGSSAEAVRRIGQRRRSAGSPSGCDAATGIQGATAVTPAAEGASAAADLIRSRRSGISGKGV